jgi:protein-tyrosine phosphatase
MDTNRFLKIEGAYNIRDLGGFKLQGERTTQKNRFLRGDCLSRLSQASQQQLIDYGVRLVIDLRSDSEIRNARDVFASHPAVEYLHVPFQDIPVGSTAEQSQAASLVEFYISMLENCQPALYKVFNRMAELDDGAVLFHCSAGKDRTGVVAALLLNLAGVPDVAIAYDYALSASNLRPILYLLRASRPGKITSEEYITIMGAEYEKINGFLNYLHQKYNGASGYLQSINLSAAQIERLKYRLTGQA